MGCAARPHSTPRHRRLHGSTMRSVRSPQAPPMDCVHQSRRRSGICWPSTRRPSASTRRADVGKMCALTCCPVTPLPGSACVNSTPRMSRPGVTADYARSAPPACCASGTCCLTRAMWRSRSGCGSRKTRSPASSVRPSRRHATGWQAMTRSPRFFTPWATTPSLPS